MSPLAEEGRAHAHPPLSPSRPGVVSTPPPDVGATPDGPPTLGVVPWTDPVIDTLGDDPRSSYVEQFRLPVVGPPTIGKTAIAGRGVHPGRSRAR